MNFVSEKEMSDTLRSLLEEITKDNNCFFEEELKGITGIPDYVLYEKYESTVSYIISFELKLKNWKQAIKQAFRYRNFSNDSIVILDEYVIELALSNLDYFEKYNIGLGSFNNKCELKIHFYPTPSKPFSRFYIDKIIDKFSKEQQPSYYESCNDSILTKKLITHFCHC